MSPKTRKPVLGFVALSTLALSVLTLAQTQGTSATGSLTVNVISRTQINISGSVSGGSIIQGTVTCTGGCCGQHGQIPQQVPIQASAWYGIDTTITQQVGIPLTQTLAGQTSSCTTHYQPYVYSYNLTINTSSLSTGQHTITAFFDCAGSCPDTKDTQTFTLP